MLGEADGWRFQEGPFFNVTPYNTGQDQGFKSRVSFEKITGVLRATSAAEWNAYLANQWQAMGYNITEKKDALPDAEEWKAREKSEEDILTWETDEE